MDSLNDTIVAIGTPLGKGGIGVVRLSGPAAKPIAQQLTRIDSFPPRELVFARVYDHHDESLLDEGCVVFFKGPQSYTGDDVVEFQLHSNPLILKKVLQSCIHHGARLAQAGEFTRLAFLNGKMSLSKAESVIDLIDASTTAAHHISLHHYQGRLHALIQGYRDQLMRLLEQLEGCIDFPDEVPVLDREMCDTQLTQSHHTLTQIINAQDFGDLIKTGLKVVIVGQPNVGKSSLLNALLGHDRAIVTDIAGTTRDYITETVEFNQIQCHITDTAGIHETTDRIESAGMAKIESLIQNAHGVIWVVDATHGKTAADQAILDRIQHINPTIPIIAIAHKCDQSSSTSLDDEHDWLAVSSQTQHGLSDLKQQLHFMYQSLTEGVDTQWICNIRQVDCLQRLASDIQDSLDAIRDHVDDAVLAISLKRAVMVCGELTGDHVTEEMLDGIFSRFCVGK